MLLLLLVAARSMHRGQAYARDDRGHDGSRETSQLHVNDRKRSNVLSRR